MLYIGFVLGVLFGSCITQIILRSRFMGSIIIVTSKEESPYLFLELKDSRIESIANKKYVSFEVKAQK
jgi:Na+/serine symporter